MSQPDGGQIAINRHMELEQLQQRLERVERQNLFLKRAGAGALVLVWIAVALSVLAGLMRDDRVEARQFTLIDGEGKPRAILAHGDDDGFYLIFYDAHRRERAVFGVTGDHRPVLGVMATDEKARLGFEVDQHDAPQMGLFDQQHQLRAALKVSVDGEPKLSLLDSNRKRRAVVRLLPNGQPELVFFDESERPVRRIVAPGTSDTE